MYSQKLKKYDIIIKMDERRNYDTHQFFIIIDILSTSPNGSIEIQIMPLSTYCEDDDTEIPIFIDEIFIDDIVIVGQMRGVYMDSLLNNFRIHKNSDIVRINGIDVLLDFGEYDEEEELQKMADILVDNIVKHPSMAKEFIDTYRDVDDLHELEILYGMSEKQVKKTVSGIIKNYSINRD